MTSTTLPNAATPDATLNVVQSRTATQVLGLGQDRPHARPGLVDDLRSRLVAGTRDAVAAWSEPSLFLSKSQLATVLRCEGAYKHGKEQPRTPGVLPAVAQGTVAHRALQLCHTHPRVPVEDNVRAAVSAEARADRGFDMFWNTLDVVGQSDLIVAVTGTVMTFLDSWPTIQTSWSPRYEFGMQARVGSLTLSGRADMVLGRPRADGRQTMVVVDWKSGNLYPDHEAEADFYALLATFRFGLPPYRSFVYSLASAETTRLDVDEERLLAAVDTVIAAANAVVEVMGGTRAPVLNPTPMCAWCPGRAVCPALAALNGPANLAEGPAPAP